MVSYLTKRLPLYEYCEPLMRKVVMNALFVCSASSSWGEAGEGAVGKHMELWDGH